MNFSIPSIILKKASSTNDIAMKIEVDYPLFAIISDLQLKGKGRFKDRIWFSEEKTGLFLSILINSPDYIDTDALSYITKISALSVIKSLNFITSNKKKFRLKEPNDIYFENKKISGVLAESQTKGESIVKIVAGMGVNLIKPEILPEDIIDKAVYLSELINIEDFDIIRQDMANYIITEFIKLFNLIKDKKYLLIDEKFKEFML
ncbi:MAG: biotin--[acetyl-CoA-carboxylase] ligase [Candidatus Muirbacterium halophilum]|nr:biotin--[acetyl-CoA-carboxylase] ligase [Candidatus Muirbacterium halophilum]